jgi:tRNA/rRNA methyltransferase
MSSENLATDDPLDRITIILCRPEGQANIGSICRAMKTMGLLRLKIVDMQSEEDLLSIRMWALDAFDIYQNAVHYPSLAEAIVDTQIVAATSRRTGKNRKFFGLTAREFANQIPSYAGNSVAIVFGNEKHGLNEVEVDLCHILLSIPTCDLYPSLNLAQAVQIVAYEIYMQQKASNMQYTAISTPSVAQLADHITKELDSFGFFAISGNTGRRHLFNFWNAVIARALLSQNEATFLEKMIRQIAKMKRKEPFNKKLSASTDNVE